MIYLFGFGDGLLFAADNVLRLNLLFLSEKLLIFALGRLLKHGLVVGGYLTLGARKVIAVGGNVRLKGSEHIVVVHKVVAVDLAADLNKLVEIFRKQLVIVVKAHGVYKLNKIVVHRVVHLVDSSLLLCGACAYEGSLRNFVSVFILFVDVNN